MSAHATPSIFSSHANRASSATTFATRAAHASSSSNENALSSESIGARCGTGANRSAGVAPTRCVGESGVISSGNRSSSWSSSRDQLVVVGVGDLRRVEHVVQVAVLVDLVAELLDAELRLGPRSILGADGHPAISTAPATPIRSPITITPPRTPGTRWR